MIICDWLWENPPLAHKDKYLVQSVMSREGLKLHTYKSIAI